MTKIELRKIFLQRRARLTADERARASVDAAKLLFDTFDFAPVRVVHCFLPIERFYEIDTSFIFDTLWRRFPQILTVAPRVDAARGSMDSVVYTADTTLSENSWQIREPETGEPIAPEQIDVIIFPLLCSDRRGHRVGYGKGFYDRFAARCRPDCLKIGINYFAPIEKIADAAGFDVRLDFCVTPIKTFVSETNGS